ncbi:hypothetical protein TSUD_75060 [Trifolium subterraneum]|nr:hypothetical protein TSUD_75060 [Trifolium subterraneum]
MRNYDTMSKIYLMFLCPWRETLCCSGNIIRWRKPNKGRGECKRGNFQETRMLWRRKMLER